MTGSWRMFDDSILSLKAGVSTTQLPPCMSFTERKEQMVNTLAMSYLSINFELQLTWFHASERLQINVYLQRIVWLCRKNFG